MIDKNRLDLVKNFGLIILIIIVSFLAYDLEKQGEKEFEALGYFGILVVGFLSSVVVFLPAPATAILLFLIINAQDKFIATLSAALGSTLGELTGYVFGNSTREIIVNIKKSKNNIISFSFMQEILKKYFSFILFVFAFIPNPFFDFIGTVAGYYKYDLKKFFVIVFIAKILRFIILTDVVKLIF
ncbi:MAG: VTT domain-containing protein [Candidatus Micrarchaeota archaeon]|nr:VTT domain-containing protein [Candidatus Micrarchaeota archaeon]